VLETEARCLRVEKSNYAQGTVTRLGMMYYYSQVPNLGARMTREGVCCSCA